MFLTLRCRVSGTSVDHLHRTQFHSGVDYLSITGVTEVCVEKLQEIVLYKHRTFYFNRTHPVVL